ncbi:MAG: hypothetical protein HY898_36080 [Deltaproteobacteria bacterium]|nr:hypothetical protein [Deltaproteobacteria bacterium]
MRRLAALLLVTVASCSSDPSGEPPGIPPVSDGGDASAQDSAVDQSSGQDAADSSAPDPCGPIGPSFGRCARNPLYTAGSKHADGKLELFVADPSVMYDEEDKKWKAWWQSPLDASYLSPDPATAILYAESEDGLTWVVQQEPVLQAKRAPADWDYDRLETPSVIKVPSNPPDRRYVLFYSGGNFAAVQSPITGYVWYQIGVAFSADGRSFQRLPASESPYAGKTTPYQNIEGLLLLGRDAFPGMTGVHDGLVADPEIVVVDGTWHLYFSSMPVDVSYTPLAFGISHATSTDGLHWTMSQGNPVVPGGMQPSVVYNDAIPRFELFYNGDSDAEKSQAPSQFNPSVFVSHATSTDGASFQEASPKHVFAWDGSHSYEAYGWLTGADVALRPDGYWLFYTGFSKDAVPKDFWVPASQSWCGDAGAACTCFSEDGGPVTCLLPSVVTFNLARKTP